MTTRLIVSFIGEMDLACFGFPTRKPAAPCDQSPVLRLLLHLAMAGLCTPGRTRLMLFDDRPQDGMRTAWCAALQARLPEIGLAELAVDLRPAPVSHPNDLNALYAVVFGAVPTTRPDAVDEVLFHISSGAWGMQSTLMLAACCLPLRKARLFETSWQAGVREVELPYVLFAREARRHLPSRARLPEAARRKLLPDTVVDDATVEEAYGVLARAAAKKKAPQSLLVTGPSGSGKWHAARQFARWRGGAAVEWTLPGLPAPDSLPGSATVLVWRLDAWGAEALQGLAAWRVARPDLSVVATWRTDMPARANLHQVARDGLRGAGIVNLPALGARSDIVALGEAVARQAGLWSGKVVQRLQYELGTDVYARNLHDLKQVLVLADAHSADNYPDARGWLRARQIKDAEQREALLREAFDVLANLRFGPGRGRGPKLPEVLELVKALVVQAAIAQGRTQQQAGELLGYEQTGISEIVNREIDMGPWRTRVEPVDTAEPEDRANAAAPWGASNPAAADAGTT